MYVETTTVKGFEHVHLPQNNTRLFFPAKRRLHTGHSKLRKGWSPVDSSHLNGKWSDTVDGRNPANQLRLVVYPIIYRVLYIPGGAGFLSLTVWTKGFWVKFDAVFVKGMEAFGDFPWWNSTCQWVTRGKLASFIIHSYTLYLKMKSQRKKLDHHFHRIASFWNQLRIFKENILTSHPNTPRLFVDPDSEFRAPISPTNLPPTSGLEKLAKLVGFHRQRSSRFLGDKPEVWKKNGSRNVRCLTFEVEKKTTSAQEIAAACRFFLPPNPPSIAPSHQ